MNPNTTERPCQARECDRQADDSLELLFEGFSVDLAVCEHHYGMSAYLWKEAGE